LRARATYILTAVAALAAIAFAGASPATAEQRFDRCPTDPSAVLPGPEICEFGPFTGGGFFPAGTRCDFDVTVSYQYWGTIYFFDQPPRAVAHTVSLGTATGNGHTLVRTGRFTETASPIIVFTDHGLLARYSLPAGGTITVWAGYQQDSILPPEPEIFHGNPPPGIDPADTAAFCAALAD
jgi:hypothetical protein